MLTLSNLYPSLKKYGYRAVRAEVEQQIAIHGQRIAAGKMNPEDGQAWRLWQDRLDLLTGRNVSIK